MKEWEKRLAHAKADRDALVACGNPAPNRPDPPGGMIPVKALRFSTAIYTNFMRPLGHTTIEYENCLCGRRN